MVMIRPRGKASRIHKAIFSVEDKMAKKQKPKARMDESLGERRGAERTKKQNLKSRRDESRGKKRMSNLISRDYSLNTRPRNP